MKKFFSKEVIIGICVILTLAILFFGIEFLKGINLFKTSNYYYASFTNVDDLTESAPVTLDGFKVGYVREMAYDYENPGHVKVELSLDKQLRLPKGTTASVDGALIGSASVRLTLGEGEGYEEIGSTIKGTSPAGFMDNIQQDVLPSVTALIPKVDSLLTAATKVASDPALASAIKRLDDVMANLQASTRSLNATMQSLRPILANADAASANLSTASGDLASLSSKLNALPLDSTFSNIYTITTDLASATNQLHSPNSTVGQLLYNAELYDNLNKSVMSLDSLLMDVKKNPKRYISIKLL